MASRQDGEKRQAWEVRLARRRASGLTVAQFCQREGVSVNTFYYWSKRVGSVSAKTPSPRPDHASRRSQRRAKHTPVPDGSPNPALVRFHWKGEVEVLVPADCLDAIRCLAARLPQARAGHAAAFQEVLVRS